MPATTRSVYRQIQAAEALIHLQEETRPHRGKMQNQSLLLNLPWELVLLIAEQLDIADLRSFRLSMCRSKLALPISLATETLLYRRARFDITKHCISVANDPDRSEWEYVRDLSFTFHRYDVEARWMNDPNKEPGNIFRGHPHCTRYLVPLMKKMKRVEVLTYDICKNEPDSSIAVDPIILSTLLPKLLELHISTVFFPKFTLPASLSSSNSTRLTTLKISLYLPTPLVGNLIADDHSDDSDSDDEVTVEIKPYIANVSDLIACSPYLRVLSINNDIELAHPTKDSDGEEEEDDSEEDKATRISLPLPRKPLAQLREFTATYPTLLLHSNAMDTIFRHIRNVYTLNLTGRPIPAVTVPYYNDIWAAYMEDEDAVRPTRIKVCLTSTAFVDFLASYPARSRKVTHLHVTCHSCDRPANAGKRAIVRDCSLAGKIFWKEALPIHASSLVELHVMPGESQALSSWWFSEKHSAAALKICTRLTHITVGGWASYSPLSAAKSFVRLCVEELPSVMRALWVWRDFVGRNIYCGPSSSQVNKIRKAEEALGNVRGSMEEGKARREGDLVIEGGWRVSIPALHEGASAQTLAIRDVVWDDEGREWWLEGRVKYESEIEDSEAEEDEEETEEEEVET